MSRCEQRYRPVSEFQGEVRVLEGRVTVVGRVPGVEIEGEEKEQVGEYRSYAEDAMFSIFHVLSTFRREEGVALFYQQIEDRLQLERYQSSLQDYLLGVESSLYSLTGPVDHPNTQVDRLCRILTLVTERLPRDPLIAKTALQLIYNSTSHFCGIPGLTRSLFGYILSFLQDPAVQVLAA